MSCLNYILNKVNFLALTTKIFYTLDKDNIRNKHKSK